MTHEVKLIWHDLIEDPTDLPNYDDGYDYIVTFADRSISYDTIYKGDGQWGRDDGKGGHDLYTPGEVVAWAEPIERYRPRKKTTVFISLPMSGLSKAEICADIQKAKECYLDLTGMDICDVMFMSNADAEEDLQFLLNVTYKDLSGTLGNKDKDAIWYLGHAIKKIARCDEIFFWGRWGAARGCLIEHAVATKYHIPIVYGTYWNEEQKKDESHNGENEVSDTFDPFYKKNEYYMNRQLHKTRQELFKKEPRAYVNPLVHEALRDLENKKLRGEDKDGDKL